MVDPNLEFVDIRMTPQDALALVQVWQAGAISYETLYENLSRGEIAGEERDSAEEQDLIKQEAPPALPPGAPSQVAANVLKQILEPPSSQASAIRHGKQHLAVADTGARARLALSWPRGIDGGFHARMLPRRCPKSKYLAKLMHITLINNVFYL
jgi:hypothetical protein